MIIPREPGWSHRVSILLILGLVVVTASVTAGRGPQFVVPVFAATCALVAWHVQLTRWTALVSALIAVILFVPIGRFKLAASLPFQLELYRLAVMVLILAWASSLLIDEKVEVRRSPFDVPIAVILTATFFSVGLNVGRVEPLQQVVLKSLTFFLSFIILYYLIVSVIRVDQDIERLAAFLVGGASVVAVGAVIEQRTGYNVFDHVDSVLPALSFEGSFEDERYGLTRAVGSGQHPIALGVLLAMIFPLAVCLAQARGRLWWIVSGLIIIGVFSTLSRTAVIVLVVGIGVVFALRRRDTARLLPLVIPLVVIAKLVLPGSLATLKGAFFPPGGIVAEQTVLPAYADPDLAGGRIRQLGPSLTEASQKPLFGQGFATRQTGFDNPLRNAPILDNQWLGLLLETGLTGLVGWVMLVVIAARRLMRLARDRAGPEGWLATGLAGSLAGFAIGMLTYDSLEFTQVAFVFWILLALAASLVLVTRSGTDGDPQTGRPV